MEDYFPKKVDLDLPKSFEITDNYTGEDYTIHVRATPHAYQRFSERPKKDSHHYIANVLKNAAQKIVNDYLSEPGEYNIKSPKTNLKIPIIVSKTNKDIGFYIPTALTLSMTSSRQKYSPVVTVEDITYSLYKEIIVD